MTEYGRLYRNGYRPQRLIDNNRNKHLVKVFFQHGRAFKNIAICKNPYLCIQFKQIKHDNGKLENSRHECADGRTRYTHLRKAEITEYERIVYPRIDDKRHDGNIKRNLDRFHTAQRRH